MRRRKFITLLAGAAGAWPLAVGAQQTDRVRRIGLLMNFRSDELEGQARVAAFAQSLQNLGGTRAATFAPTSAGLETKPTAIASTQRNWWDCGRTSSSRLPARAWRAATDPRSVPIVFANVVDPVGAGYVTSLARPGGNTTGFTAFEYSIGGKWLELLKEIVPSVTRVAVIRDPAIAAGIGQFAAIQSSAPSSVVELT